MVLSRSWTKSFALHEYRTYLFFHVRYAHRMNPLHLNLNLPNDAISSPSTKEPQWGISCRSEFVLNWSTCVCCLRVYHKKALLHWPEDKNLKIWKVDAVFLRLSRINKFLFLRFHLQALSKLCPSYFNYLWIGKLICLSK